MMMTATKMMTTENNTIQITNRKLENFLYILGVKPIGMFKSLDDMTTWVYDDSPELRKLIEDYKNYKDASRKNEHVIRGVRKGCV